MKIETLLKDIRADAATGCHFSIQEVQITMKVFCLGGKSALASLSTVFVRAGAL